MLARAQKQEGAEAPSYFVHPAAFVSPDSTVGSGSRVWQFASVIRGAVLGLDCNVASGVTVDGARFGDRCIISQGVTLAPGQEFGSDVFLGPNVTVCNDRWPRVEKTGFDVAEFADRATVRVGDGTSIGAGAIVLPGITIGERAMIAAGAIVDRNIPDDYLLKRDGRIVPIDGRTPVRMRFV